MSSAARKTSAAFAAGCSVILKAAEETPGTACELVKCFEEAGLIPVLMELGGHAPVRVDDGVNPAEIGRLAALAKVRASGQIWASPSRVIVHRNSYPDFVDAAVSLDSAVMTTEPLGPLAACVQVEDLDEDIDLANSLSVGLAAYAFTNSLEDAEKISGSLQCGVLSINHYGVEDSTPEHLAGIGLFLP